ncbi:hypothetical protein QA597_02305 [Marinilabiliaceae bacterium ANBcel2]|nr:hypothetical protein [Marinilabiliaceae bacterium ANBcel2]
MSSQKIVSTTYLAAMLLILTGVFLATIEHESGKYLFSIGLIPYTAIRVYRFIRSSSDNKRKNFILLISNIMLILSVAAIFANKSYWMILILIAAVIDLIISLRKDY